MTAHRTTNKLEAASNAVRLRYTVIYDGDCAYCRKQADRMRSRDFEGRFEFVPSQTADLLERFPQLAGDDFNTGLRVVEPDGRVHVGADAVYQVARRLAGSRWVAWLYHVPGIAWLARRAYARIAARRHRF